MNESVTGLVTVDNSPKSRAQTHRGTIALASFEVSLAAGNSVRPESTCASIQITALFGAAGVVGGLARATFEEVGACWSRDEAVEFALTIIQIATLRSATSCRVGRAFTADKVLRAECLAGGEIKGSSATIQVTILR